MRWFKRIRRAIAIGKIAKRTVRAAKRLVNDKPKTKRDLGQDNNDQRDTDVDRD